MDDRLEAYPTFEVANCNLKRVSVGECPDFGGLKAFFVPPDTMSGNVSGGGILGRLTRFAGHSVDTNGLISSDWRKLGYSQTFATQGVLAIADGLNDLKLT